jgi:hypothetical protein
LNGKSPDQPRQGEAQPCSPELKSEQPDTVASLAAALLGLSPENRARLAAILLGQHQGG